MKETPFYFEVQDIITQFVAGFDSIIINRYTQGDKSPEQQIRVRYLFMPKQRVLHNLVNKAEHITVPAVSVWNTNVTRDESRVFNKNQGQWINRDSVSDFIRQPVPVDISLDMSIIGRYRQDIDQILSNFIPYNDPYIVLSWKVPPEFTSTPQEIRSTVLWNGSVSMDTPTQMGEGDKFRIIADTSFTIKTWLFKKHEETASGNIFYIDANFYPVSSFRAIDDLDVVETRSLSALPQTTYNTTTTFFVGEMPTYRLEGDNFNYTTGVYLSSNNVSSFNLSSTFNDPFSGRNIESRFPGFFGAALSSISIFNDNVMYITLPEVLSSGTIRIVITNEAGYVFDKPISLFEKL